MVMRHHGPKTLKSGSRDTYTPLRKVTLKKRLDEVFSPCNAIDITSGQVGKGKTAPQPQVLLRFETQLRTMKIRHVKMVFHGILQISGF
jgi:hypothetical protein